MPADPREAMQPVVRIIDAAANRAREALRVLEDVSRFVLSDQPLCADLKAARHELIDLLGAIPVDPAGRLAWRDTPGDVGTEVSTVSEGERAGLQSVAAAAGARLGEALRSLEECAKVVAPGRAPAGLERLRYRAYELERRVLAAVPTGRSRQWRLCVLITLDLCVGRAREDVARAAISGGADCIQLREKSLEGHEVLNAARSLRTITRDAGAALIINDRVDIALLSGADGVHVGQGDLSVRDVRRLAGASLLVGVSTSRIDEARRAVEAGADYCGIGPMFASTTKRRPSIAGPDAVRAYLADPQTSSVAHLAIGGISVENIAEVGAAGARGVAVSSAVCSASDPTGVCRRILETLDRASEARARAR